MTDNKTKSTLPGVPVVKYTIGYVRVSSEEQAKSGLSIDFQEQKIREFAQLKDLKDIQVMRDEGKSAKTLDRPSMMKIINLVEDGKLDMLIVYKLDRLTRSVKDLMGLIEIFDKHDVKFVSISDNFDTSTAQGKLIVTFIGGIAEWERNIISERTGDALGVKRGRNEKLGGRIPYGYEIKLSDKINRKGGKVKMLVPIKTEQTVIKKIVNLRRKGWAYNKIARLLNYGGYKTKTGAKWYHTTVNQILGREK